MKRIGITWTVALLAIALTGCTAASSESADYSGGSLPSTVLPGTLPGDASEEIGTPGSTQSDAASVQERAVIVQGSIVLTSEDPLAAANDAVRIVETAGGRIDSRTEQPSVGDVPASAQLVVRIPSDRLTAVLADIESTGTVQQVSISKADVTEQSRDIDARITALQASVDRLLALLSSATDTADLIEVETALSTRQADLESLQAQRRSLSDQVDLATISLNIGAPETAPVDRPDNFWTGIGAGWDSLLGFFGATLVALGVALPWLTLVGVLVLIAVLVRRVVRRRTATPATPNKAADRPDEDN